MVIFDEKRYASACLEPPVPKCYLGQLDAQNDVLVLENLEYSGYKKYAGGKYFSDVDHCKIVLRRIAHFHAFSTLIQVKQQQQQQQQHQQQQLNVTGIWTQVKMTVRAVDAG